MKYAIPTWPSATADDRVDARPEIAIGIDDLVHAVIVASKSILRLAKELTQRERTGLLPGIRRLPVGLRRDDRMGERRPPLDCRSPVRWC